MHVALYIVQALLMLAGPVGLWWWLRRHWHARWGLLGAGAVAFVVSQVVHVPMLMASTAAAKHGWMGTPSPAAKLVLNAALLGLYAGLCEELARWTVLRFWQKRARGFRDAIVFGAGHGGIEALLIGVAALAMLVGMLQLRHMDLQTLPVEARTRELLADQVRQYWSAPWYLPFLGVFERLGALAVQLSLSTLVMQCFVRRRLWPLALAIAWHALVDGLAVYTMARAGVVATEGLLVVLALASVGIVLWSRRVMEELADPESAIS
jgi:uncharacterized membrane protein YhfC